jgi:hypothetical protein
VAEIQRKVIKQGKRNAATRLFHAKTDKETITAWRLDLNRILHIFNVRSAGSVWQSLTTSPFQTELAITTHVVVSNTHAMVSDLHRNALKVQGGSGDQHRSVSATPIDR